MDVHASDLLPGIESDVWCEAFLSILASHDDKLTIIEFCALKVQDFRSQAHPPP
jgi:hypothetical protein